MRKPVLQALAAVAVNVAEVVLFIVLGLPAVTIIVIMAVQLAIVHIAIGRLRMPGRRA